MYAGEDLEEVQYDLDKPRMAVYRILGKLTKIQYIGAICSSLRRIGKQFYQTRSHAIVLYNTLPAICIEKAVCMKTKEEL